MPTPGLKSLRSHRNIVEHYADLLEQSISPVLLTFKAYTPLGDLDAFLSSYAAVAEGEPSHGEVVGSSYRDLRIHYILDAFAGVSDGLEHLYHHYQLGTKKQLHIDVQLTPKNILIFPDSNNPAGRWKINNFNAMVVTTDHGSTVYHNVTIAGGNVHLGDTYLNYPDVPRINNIETEPQSMSLIPDHVASAETVESQYEAPEETIAPFSIVEQSRVWSLGCIFLEVLIFSTAFPNAENELRFERLDLNKFREGLDGRHFFSNSSDDPSEPRFDIQETVSSFLDKLSEQEPFEEVVHHMPQLLCADHHDRHDTKRASALVHQAIDVIKRKSKNPESRRLPGHQVARPIRQSTRWATSVPLKQFAVYNALEVATSAHRWTLTIFEHSVIAMACKKQSSVGEKNFLTKPITGGFRNYHKANRYGLPAHSWHELHCSGSFGCLTSRYTNTQQSVAFYLFDVAERRTIEFKGGGPSSLGLRMVVPSRNGIFAFAYPHRIELWAIEGIQPDIVPLPSEKDNVLRIAVNAEGTQLFVYIERIESQSDILQVWDIGIGRKPGHVGDAYIAREDRRLSSKQIHLVACDIRNTCVVVHADLVMMVHATLSSLNKQKRYAGEPVSVKKGLFMTENSLSLASDGRTLLLVDGKYKLRAFTVHETPTSVALENVGSIRLPSQDVKWALVRYESGAKYEVVVGVKMEECDAYMADLSDIHNGTIQLHLLSPPTSSQSSSFQTSSSLQSSRESQDLPSLADKFHIHISRKRFNLRRMTSKSKIFG